MIRSSSMLPSTVTPGSFSIPFIMALKAPQTSLASSGVASKKF